MKYPLLHETLKVGSIVLKNRLVMPPMATEKSAKGQVTDGLIAYYGDMARSGPGLIIQEHSFVSPDGRASANQVSLAADADIPGLQRYYRPGSHQCQCCSQSVTGRCGPRSARISPGNDARRYPVHHPGLCRCRCPGTAGRLRWRGNPFSPWLSAGPVLFAVDESADR